MDTDAIGYLFAGVMPIRLRRMFGGVGVFDGELMFALVADGELYFKAGAEEQPLFVAAGSKPFTYDRKGKPTSLGYWTLPDEAFDDSDALRRWTALALRGGPPQGLSQAGQATWLIASSASSVTVRLRPSRLACISA